MRCLADHDDASFSLLVSFRSMEIPITEKGLDDSVIQIRSTGSESAMRPIMFEVLDASRERALH